MQTTHIAKAYDSRAQHWHDSKGGVLQRHRLEGTRLSCNLGPGTKNTQQHLRCQEMKHNSVMEHSCCQAPVRLCAGEARTQE